MTLKIAVAILIVLVSAFVAPAATISGKVTKAGEGIGGVFVSAHDLDNRKSTGILKPFEFLIKIKCFVCIFTNCPKTTNPCIFSWNKPQMSHDWYILIGEKGNN